MNKVAYRNKFSNIGTTKLRNGGCYMVVQNMCVDCGTDIGPGSTRCYTHAAKHRWTDPEFRAKFSAAARSKSKAKKRKVWLEGMANGLCCRASSRELVIKKFLDDNFAEVIHQYVPDEHTRIGVYDFYIADIDTLVEVDGHYDNDPHSDDEEKEKWALEHDYGFVRIVEDNVKSTKYMLSFLEELLEYE